MIHMANTLHITCNKGDTTETIIIQVEWQIYDIQKRKKKHSAIGPIPTIAI